MIEIELFRKEVLTAYENLYNIPYLQSSPVLPYLVRHSEDKQQAARQLKRTLLTTIENLYPGDNAPVTSREWRLHRLLTLRYVEGLSPQQIADQLAISLRHYYREQKEALEQLVNLLWQRAQSAKPAEHVARGDLLRTEVERISRDTRGGQLTDVLDGVLVLMQPMLVERDIELMLELPEVSVHLGVSSTLMRQLLIESLTRLLSFSEPNATLHIECKVSGDFLLLYIGSSRLSAALMPKDMQTALQLAAFSNVAFEIEKRAGRSSLQLRIPIQKPKTILLVDDNDDVIQLLLRYLNNNGYRIVIAQTGQQAIELALELKPFAIALDVMIPEPDGWTVLQTLRNNIETHQIPIILMTVLSASDLAEALGAYAFLEKPIAEADLIRVLDSIESAQVT